QLEKGHQMSALMIARITVKDPQKFQEYLAASRQIATRYGAELLYRGSANRALNGDDDHALVVIAKFPSAQDIDDWFASDAYQPLAALRDQGADMQMTSYEITTP
ncbi:MAG: DUF1330 domain-containing protein, partial [Aestuariivirgaceae bacterium]